MRSGLIFLCLASIGLPAAPNALAEQANSQEPLDIGSRLELFVDDYLIESMVGVRLELHEPRSAGKVFAFDQPWEGNVSWPLSAFQDGDLYRLYYLGRSAPDYVKQSALEPGEVVSPKHPDFLSYAESGDGVHWAKPDLGLYEFDGSKENNILRERFGDPPALGVPFLDTRPGVDPSERYKVPGHLYTRLGQGASRENQGELMLASSSDGLNWKRWHEDQQLFVTSLPGAFDSANVIFWSEREQRYVLYFRYSSQGTRSFARTTSRDLLNWTEAVPCTFDGWVRPPEHLYTNAATPYYRAPHIYLSFPKRFVPQRKFHQDASYGISETVFMTSRDGIDWNPFMEALIRPGRDQRNWVHRTTVTAAGLLQTGEDEISLYVSRNYTYPSTYLERFVLRVDGFVSAHSGHSGGELVTKPLLFQGENLILNYATSAAGSIRV